MFHCHIKLLLKMQVKDTFTETLKEIRVKFSRIIDLIKENLGDGDLGCEPEAMESVWSHR